MLTTSTTIPEPGAKKIRALIVDDSPDLAMKLNNLIEMIPGIETAGFAANGAEAIRMTDILRPELVIMDVHMPVMDGVEAARMIRDLFPGSKVVLTSVFGPPGISSFPGLETTDFVPKSQLWRALPELVGKMTRA